jgi:lysophospholipase L1-like esterase
MAVSKARLYTLFTLLCVLAVILSGCSPYYSGVGSGVINSPDPSSGSDKSPPPSEEAGPSTAPTVDAAVSPAASSDPASPGSSPEGTGGIEPEPPDVSDPGASSEPSPGGDDFQRMPSDDVYVREMPAVENSYFSDAAFVGNSLVEGLKLFSGITECDYYSATSMSVLGVDSVNVVQLQNGTYGTILQGLAQESYAKVYILLGINEIGLNLDDFISAYGDMLDKVRDIQPDAVIYIMSITPVSRYKSSTSDIFNMERIYAFNQGLHDLAVEKGCYYLDVCSALSGPDGYLPADVTSDGVHFAASVYAEWADFLRTHYV